MSDNLKQFNIRKTGDDLATNKDYNAWNPTVRSNPFFPEYAPKSVGGTMSGPRNKDSEGNCTWYARGRVAEVWGEYIPRPHLIYNANQWLNTGFRKSDKPSVGAVAVFDDGKYGHVAFVEKIDKKGNVIVSESSYSERGNDFLFKYGRTVEDIKKAWGMRLLGYIPAPMALESVDTDEPKETEKERINRLVQEVWKGLHGNGEQRKKSLGKDYDAVMAIINGSSKPEPSKPITNVGRNWSNSKLPLNLYSSPTTTTAYKGKSKTRRTYTILAEEGKRIQIKHALFDAPGGKVWVNTADGKIV